MYDDWQSLRSAKTATTASVTGTSPIVTDFDEDSGTDPNFPSAPNPHEGPPSGGTWGMGMEPIQDPESMEIVERPRALRNVKKMKEKMKMQRPLFVRKVLARLKTVAILDDLDDEPTKMVQMLVILRLNKTHQSLDSPAGGEKNGNRRAGWIDAI